jgi:hypothetical protein
VWSSVMVIVFSIMARSFRQDRSSVRAGTVDLALGSKVKG